MSTQISGSVLLLSRHHSGLTTDKTNHSLLGSEIIELIADDGRVTFIVHKSLLARQSEFLRTDTTSTVDGKYDLQSWDGKTVGYFVDYLYLRAYNVQNPEPLYPATSSPEGTVSDTTEALSRSDTPDTIQGERSQDSTYPRALTPIQYLLDSFDSEDHGGFPREDVNHGDSLATQDYRWVMFAHAKVYALAQSLGIDDLQRMAYRELAGVLAGFEPAVEGSVVATSSIEIMRYVYSKCHSAGDPMRNLVTQFAALNFPALQRMEGMKEVLGGGGELAVDLFEKLCRRLVATEGQLRGPRGHFSPRAAPANQEFKPFPEREEGDGHSPVLNDREPFTAPMSGMRQILLPARKQYLM